MICRFNFPYGWLKNCKPETYAEIRKLVPELAEDQTKAESFCYSEGDIRPLIRMGVPIEIAGESVKGSLHFDIAERLDRIEAAMLRRAHPSNDSTFNKRVNVHVAGLGTLLVDEIELEKDCCTDHLRSRIEDGWRILAVCVQPDQRRPDYVIGRARGKPPTESYPVVLQPVVAPEDIPF